MRYFEITEAFLPHTEDDDVAIEHQMQRAYNTPIGAPRKDRLTKLTNIGNIEVAATQWPPAFHNHFFFLDNDEPVGFAVLKQGGRARHDGDHYAITLIWLRPQYRKQGFATDFYRFLLRNGVELEPDTKQSAGGAAVWHKLRTRS